MLAEARQYRDDLDLPIAEQVSQEDDLELQRVLSLVIQLIGIRIEIARGGDAVDRFLVRFDVAERRLERLAAQGERLAHRRVRRAEEDERVGILRERLRED